MLGRDDEEFSFFSSSSLSELELSELSELELSKLEVSLELPLVS